MAEPVPYPTWVDAINSKRPILGKDMGVPRMTFNSLIREQLVSSPDRLQYVTADGTEYTLQKFYNLAMRVARAIASFGLMPLDGVAIHGFNSIQWFAIDIGATLASCISSGIYTTNKPEICAYIINHSSSRLVFVDCEEALAKILSVVPACPNLQKVIIWGEYDESRFSEHTDKILTWDSFLNCGHTKEAEAIDLQAREAELSPESLCKLIYTSGTTGMPKAVMISHDNIVFVTNHFSKVVDSKIGDRIISYLPLSHIAANSIDIGGAITTGFTVYLADVNALKGSLPDTMRKVRPTLFLAVPRVYEKIQEAMMQAGASAGGLKKMIATWAKSVGTAASEATESGQPMPWGFRIAKMLVFDNVLERLGLDQCRVMINSSAPLLDVTDAYFKSLNIRIIDLYGMSEATGPLTVNYPDYKSGTSGKFVDGIEYKLVNKIDENEGEMCFRSRSLFMGYLNNPEESAKAIDNEGYCRSGDIGRIDEDGFVTITGRAKDLIVTSGGENVAPTIVESTLLSAMPALSRAFAVGDKRKFVSALVVPRMDEDGNLIGPALAVNPAILNGEQAVEDEAWKAYLKDGVAKANMEAISNASKVKQYRLLSKDFSLEGGELTPTMKVKRNVVLEMYADIIEQMYQ